MEQRRRHVPKSAAIAHGIECGGESPRSSLYHHRDRARFSGVNAAAYFQRETHALFAGEPTGGKPNSPGDETFFTLPYSKIARKLLERLLESGWPYDARWSIAPDIYTPRTFAEYVAGDDPAMDAVLNS